VIRASILPDGRVLMKLLLNKPKSPVSKAILATIDLKSEIVTTTTMADFQHMAILPDERVVMQRMSTFTILE
jgi:hypothetical protein